MDDIDEEVADNAPERMRWRMSDLELSAQKDNPIRQVSRTVEHRDVERRIQVGAGEGIERLVHPGELVSSQSDVMASRVQDFVDDPEAKAGKSPFGNPDMPLVYSLNGQLVIADGTHRAAAALERGEKIRVFVIDGDALLGKDFASGKPGKGPKMIRADSVPPKGVKKFNPNHRPGGDERGGEFAEGDASDSVVMDSAFSSAEAEAIRAYADTAHETDALRGAIRMTKSIERNIKLLDSAIAKSSTDKDVTLFRGLRDFDQMDWIEGKTYTDKGFLSLTGSKKIAGRFSDYNRIGSEGWGKPGGGTGALVVVRVPKGSNILSVGEYASRSDEQEFVLPRGSSFKVDRIQSGRATRTTPAGKLVSKDIVYVTVRSR